MRIPISKVRHNLWKLAERRDLNPRPIDPHPYHSAMEPTLLHITLPYYTIGFLFSYYVAKEFFTPSSQSQWQASYD